MSVVVLLIAVSLGLGLVALGSFLWALRAGQFEDLDGGAHRILDDDAERPLPRVSGNNRARSAPDRREQE